MSGPDADATPAGRDDDVHPGGDDIDDDQIDIEALERRAVLQQVTPPQALMAIAFLCLFCIAIGFVLGRTL